jgi:regulator of Ty1 transposition protein 103
VEPFAIALQKADLNTKPAVTTANQDFEKFTNPNNPVRTAPVRVGELGALFRKLAVAESAAADSIKARRELITGLEKLLETNKTKLGQEEAQLAVLTTRKSTVDSRRQEVEDAITRGFSAERQNAIAAAPLPGVVQVDHERPQVEELTPPPMESFTPVGSPRPDVPDVPDDVFREPPANPVEPVSVPAPLGVTAMSPPVTAIGPANPIPGADLLRSLTQGLTQARNDEHNGAYGPSSAKKRKMSRSAAEDEFAVFAADEDVNGIDSNLLDLV